MSCAGVDRSSLDAELNAASLTSNATLKVTKIVLPGMISRKRGLILNVGSFAALIPSPLLAVYSGSKAFLSTWSQALGSELKGTGVHVELLNAYFVVSAGTRKLNNRRIADATRAAPDFEAQQDP